MNNAVQRLEVWVQTYHQERFPLQLAGYVECSMDHGSVVGYLRDLFAIPTRGVVGLYVCQKYEIEQRTNEQNMLKKFHKK